MSIETVAVYSAQVATLGLVGALCVCVYVREAGEAMGRGA